MRQVTTSTNNAQRGLEDYNPFEDQRPAAASIYCALYFFFSFFFNSLPFHDVSNWNNCLDCWGC